MPVISSATTSLQHLRDISLIACEQAFPVCIFAAVGLLNGVKLDLSQPFVGGVVSGSAYLVNKLVSPIFEKYRNDLAADDYLGSRHFSRLTVRSMVYVGNKLVVGVTTVMVSVAVANLLGFSLTLSLASRILLDVCVDLLFLIRTFGDQILGGQEDGPDSQQRGKVMRNFAFLEQETPQRVLRRRALWQTNAVEILRELPPNPSEPCPVCLEFMLDHVVGLEC
jgi:hypothetical protein